MLCIIILSFQKLTTSWKLSCQVGKLTRDLSCPVWNGSCPVDILTKIQKKKKSWLYSDVIMGDSIWNHQPHNCLLSRLFRGRSKKTSKLHVTGLCVRNSRGTSEFSAQMASNAENVSIWWHHHDKFDCFQVSVRQSGWGNIVALYLGFGMLLIATVLISIWFCIMPDLPPHWVHFMIQHYGWFINCTQIGDFNTKAVMS